MRAALSRGSFGQRGAAILRRSLPHCVCGSAHFLRRLLAQSRNFVAFQMEIANPVGTPSTACIAVTTMR